MECDEHKNSLCRVCLKCDPKIHESGANIFDKTEDFFIYERLNRMCDVDIKPEDGFPDRICVECLLELQNAVRFKNKCENSNNVLLSAVNTNNEPAVKEEAIEDVKLEEDDCTDHEFLDQDEEDEPHSPPPGHVKHDHEELQEFEYIQLKQQPNTERPSRAIDLKLECHDCGGLFKSKCKLKVHWKKEHLKQYLTCDKCKNVFKSFKAFHNHKRNDSEFCNSVEAMFQVEGTGRFRKFFCKQCQYSASTRDSLKSHIQKHKGVRFQCELCPMSYTKLSSLIVHKESKHEMYKKEGPCDICGEYIKGQHKLLVHIRTKHRKKKKVEVSCDICHKVYKNKEILKEHMNKHTGKRLSCNVCFKEYTLKSSLHIHKKNAHGKKSFNICPICGYSASRRAAVMKLHIAKHKPDNCACDVCGRFFENDAQLQLHKQRHNDRNNRCTECDKTYFRRKHLVNHMNKVHNIYLSKKTS